MYLPLCSNASEEATNFETSGFHKTQKSGYLVNETFFLQIKKFIDYTSRAALWQKIVL